MTIAGSLLGVHEDCPSRMDQSATWLNTHEPVPEAVLLVLS